MPGKHDPAELEDQGKKLRYLMRSRIARRPSDDRIVKSQKMLADIIEVDTGILSHWMSGDQRVPIPYLEKICTLFSVSAHAFTTLSYTEFCEVYKYREEALSGPGDSWRSLVRAAPADQGTILLSDPHPHARGHGPLRFPPVPDETSDKVQRVPAGTPFWVEFESPQGSHGRPVWAGRHILLFIHDCQTHMFKCYLPAYQSHSAFAVTRFSPDRRGLAFPRKPVIKHPETDLGRFQWVLVTAMEALPSDIMEPLSNVDAQGLAIEPALQGLGHWLQSRPADTISLARVPYEVVPRLSQRAQ